MAKLFPSVFYLLEITNSPTSQVVILGENATFHCSASGDNFQLQWTINITSRSNPYSLAYTTTIPEYGITAQIDIEETDNGVEYTAALTVEGRVETNNTQLHCVVLSFSDNSHHESETVTLTVIGELHIVMEITKSPILQLCCMFSVVIA